MVFIKYFKRLKEFLIKSLPLNYSEKGISALLIVKTSLSVLYANMEEIKKLKYDHQDKKLMGF